MVFYLHQALPDSHTVTNFLEIGIPLAALVNPVQLTITRAAAHEGVFEGEDIFKFAVAAVHV